MEKEDAKRLLPLVNDPFAHDLLQFYANTRIEWHKRQLEDCDLVAVQGHQEAVRELKKLFAIREIVQTKAAS